MPCYCCLALCPTILHPGNTPVSDAAPPKPVCAAHSQPVRNCRHIFDDKRYVEEYFARDVESELGMSQTKLIRLAMLLGSDYTEGVNGIGTTQITLGFVYLLCTLCFAGFVGCADMDVFAKGQLSAPFRYSRHDVLCNGCICCSASLHASYAASSCIVDYHMTLSLLRAMKRSGQVGSRSCAEKLRCWSARTSPWQPYSSTILFTLQASSTQWRW